MVKCRLVVECHNSAHDKPGIRFWFPFGYKRHLERWPEAVRRAKWKVYALYNSMHSPFIERMLKLAIHL